MSSDPPGGEDATALPPTLPLESEARAGLATDETVAIPKQPVAIDDTAPAPPITTGDGLAVVAPGAYAIGAELARGGMGRIVRARDRRLDRPVAIKELLLPSEDFRSRFEREARITARLQHPAIVPIYEAGVWPSGEPFYAMKLVDGHPLEEVIARTETLADRLALLPRMTAVTEALAYAHDQRVIHRDLKPHNVLVGAFGEIVVIDWGLAKDLTTVEVVEDRPFETASDGSQTVAGSVMGTAAYMPPEQARGETVDERADVYGLGAMLYQLLSKRRPYDKRHPSALLSSVIAGPPEPLRELEPDLPPDLLAIVDKAMARDAADRYRNAGELAVDIRAFQTGQLVAVHRYSLGQLLRRWIRRHRTAVAVAAVAFAVLVVGGVVAFWRILDANAEARDERDEATHQRQTAEQTSAALLFEQGRQERLAGQTDRAHALLAAAHRVNRSRATQILLGQINADLGQRGPRVELPAVATDALVVAGGASTRILTRLANDEARAFDAATGKSIPTKIAGAWRAASPSGKYLVTETRGQLQRWDLETEISSAGPALDPDASTIVAIGDAGRFAVITADRVEVWASSGLVRGQRFAKLAELSELRHAACDDTCSIIAVDGGQVVFLTMADGTARVSAKNGAMVSALALSGDGTRFTFVSYDPVIEAMPEYDIVRGDPAKASEATSTTRAMTGKLRWSIIDRETGVVLVRPTHGPAELVDGNSVELLVAPSEIRAAALSKGKVVTAHDDFTVRVWRGADITATLTGPSTPIDRLAVDHDRGRIVAVGGHALQSWPIPPSSEDHLFILWRGDRPDRRPYRSDHDMNRDTLDVSEDGSLVLACADARACRVVELRGSDDKVVMRHEGLPRSSWIATRDWIASGNRDTDLRPARGGPTRRLAGCRATQQDQLWISTDTTRGVCVDERGIAVWTDGSSPRHLFDCLGDRRITSYANELVVVACARTSILIDTVAGAITPIPASLATAGFVAISQDADRLVVLHEGRVSIADRSGVLVTQFGRSIEAVVERHGIVYTVDTVGVVSVWDREGGGLLAQSFTRRAPPAFPHRLHVFPDGLTIIVTTVRVGVNPQLHRWVLPLETRSVEEVAGALASSRWVVERGRLVQRAPGAPTPASARTD